VCCIDFWYEHRHTQSVKIAISMRDALFRRVARAAKRLGISRSELLSRAAAAYLDHERGRHITASYDQAFGPGAEEPAPGERALLRDAARRAMREIEW
jgi:hypothetical protein